VRLTALSLNTSLNTSSVKSNQSALVMSNSLGWGENLGSVVGVECRFQGHTSWQMSQPNIQSSMWPCTGSGMAPRNSIVK
jgi:hypothetical protein